MIRPSQGFNGVNKSETYCLGYCFTSYLCLESCQQNSERFGEDNPEDEDRKGGTGNGT